MAAKTGAEHHYARLNDKLVAEMREWYAEGGISIIDIANEFNIAPSTAGTAIRGETWKHVPPVSTKPCSHCNGKGRVPM